jgi:hypothetical protein
MTKYKIYDTFSYNGEEIAVFRVKYLYDTIDTFIIIEARETYSGIKKTELYFEKNKALFEPYMNKIKFIIIDSFDIIKSIPEYNKNMLWKPEVWMLPITYDSWCREHYQRDIAGEYLNSITNTNNDHYLLYCGDVDEIPRSSVFKDLNITSGDIIHLEMSAYIYNYKWKKIYKWCYPFITTRKNLTTHKLSELRNLIPTAVSPYIKDAGWKCIYFQSYNEIYRMIESSPHRQYDSEDYKNLDHIKSCIENGQDIFNRGCLENGIANKDPENLPEFKN